MLEDVLDLTDKEVELILTRSIRRKLVIGLAFVFAMVVLLSIAGLSALHAYYKVVDSLRESRDKQPSRTNLADAVAGLFEALVHTPPDPKEMIYDSLLLPPNEKLELDFEPALWEERRKKVTEEIREFYERSENRTAPRAKSLIIQRENRLNLIKLRLNTLDQSRNSLDQRMNWIEHPDRREILLKNMLLQVGELLTLVKQIPSGDSVIDSALRDSGDIIEWRLWLIGGPTALVLGLFLTLIYCGYHWILIPIRQLHEAASRVANGDYTYRLKLRGKDEMVELAEMFNKMTARFQTDKAKLAQEVEERSRQILRNERLAGIGYFASGIAHELNNPLQAIGAAAESLTGRLGDGSMGQQLPVEDRELLGTYLGMIERESMRCQQITSRVLDFARGTNGPKMRHDLTKIVTEVLEMVTHMRKFDNRKIVFDRSEAHLADVSAAEMKQVVLNLVANGLEAMKDSGTLTIQITETVDEVVLSVHDDGCGMTANVIENLYEPFFTEKQNGKGTGLGLSITHRIVGDHGGRIEAASDGPGLGSTFRVHLPRCAKSAITTAA